MRRRDPTLDISSNETLLTVISCPDTLASRQRRTTHKSGHITRKENLPQQICPAECENAVGRAAMPWGPQSALLDL